MPVYDRKPPTQLQRFVDNSRQARTIGNAVERIRHEEKIHWLGYELSKPIGVPYQKLAIGHAAFRKAQPGNFQQRRIDIDRDNVLGDLGKV